MGLRDRLPYLEFLEERDLEPEPSRVLDLGHRVSPGKRGLARTIGNLRGNVDPK